MRRALNPWSPTRGETSLITRRLAGFSFVIGDPLVLVLQSKTIPLTMTRFAQPAAC